jgi:hypothetical protein
MLNDQNRAVLNTLKGDRDMNRTKLRNRQRGWSVGRNAERALPGRALLKIEMEVDGLSKCQADHQKETEENSSSSCGRVPWVCFAQM